MSTRWGQTDRQVPEIAIGCMRLHSVDKKQGTRLIRTALEAGVNFFDHADIYGKGECEQIFGEIVRSEQLPREELFIQTKCGIVPGEMFDFSREHIVKAVEGSLRRLRTDYVDALLLHRPDALVEPEEVAAAFDDLYTSGKVKSFGVSNHTVMQIELLKSCVRQPLAANQVQFGPAHTLLLNFGLEQNMTADGAVNRGGDLLEYCRLQHMTLQAWSPFQYGMFEGVFLSDRTGRFAVLNQTMEELADRYNVTPAGLTAAWILRHPAPWQMLAGTMSPDRLMEIIEGAKVKISRKDWYRVYMAAGNPLP